MKKIFTSLFLIGMFISTFAQGTWTQKNDFDGNARSRGVCFTIGSEAFYGTGNHLGGAAEQSDFWKYNVSTDSWSSIANFPSGMQAGIAMSIGTMGYAGIGWWSGNAHQDFYEYNPATNIWTVKANYGGNLTNDAIAIGYSNYGYVGLGAQPYSSPLNNEFNRYDPISNSWIALSTFLGSARFSSAAFEINGTLYVGGGQHKTAPHPTDFYKYNISTNTWTQIATGPIASAAGTRNSAFVIGDKAYLACGSEFWEYNSLIDVWTQLTIPFSGGVDAAFTLNGKGYVIRNYSKEVWEYSPSTSSSNCLIAEYNFSGNAVDSSGNNLNGVVNGPTLAPDRFGNPNSAYHFDGVDDFIEVADNPLLDFSANQMSVSYWAKIESYNANSSYNKLVIAKQSGSGTTQTGFNVWYTSGDAGLRIKDGVSGNFGGASIGSPSNLNQWYHVVYTWDGITGNSYVNGVLINSYVSSNAAIGANSLSLLIGKANWSNVNSEPFHGWIDDINIYSCAITQQEVDSIYNSGSVGISDNKNNNSLTVYPNPTKNLLNIANADGKYVITDVFGRLVKEISITSDKFQLNTSNLHSGIYFLISKEDNSSVKFIKQ